MYNQEQHWKKVDVLYTLLGLQPGTNVWLRRLFNISTWTWLPGSPSIPQSPTCYRAWLAYPSPTLNFSSPGSGLPWPQFLWPLLPQPFWVYQSLSPGHSTWSTVSCSPNPLSPHMAQLTLVMSTLDSPNVPASDYALPSMDNKPSPPPHLGAVLSSFCYCFSPLPRELSSVPA